MRICVSGGGTAGHVYPALTALDGFASEGGAVIWYGRHDGLEAELARQHGLPFRSVPAAPVAGVSPLSLLKNGATLLRGVLVAWLHVGRDRPDVAFVTGGYVAVPLAVAARLRGVPLAVFLPDARPGLAVKMIARLADRVMVTSPSALAELPPGRTLVTGYPVRRAVRSAERSAARARWQIPDDEPAVLVVGGSQGAHRLNRALEDAAPQLLHDLHVLHVAGPRDAARVQAARTRLAEPLALRWHVFDYLRTDDMAAAFAAADLVVSRAGAATLGELPARGLAAVLVPLALAGGHQASNARLLVEAGAAVLVPDAELTAPRLVAELKTLIGDPARLAAMGASARALDRPRAGEAIRRELVALATGGAAR